MRPSAAPEQRLILANCVGKPHATELICVVLEANHNHAWLRLAATSAGEPRLQMDRKYVVKTRTSMGNSEECQRKLIDTAIRTNDTVCKPAGISCDYGLAKKNDVFLK